MKMHELKMTGQIGNFDVCATVDMRKQVTSRLI